MACRDCITGVINEGIPTGSTTIIHGLPTYVARPEGSPKGLIVIVPDAYGWDFSNGRVLADSYAQKGGFLVYLPDFMAGHALSYEILGLTDKVMATASWFTTIFYKPLYILRAISIFVPFLFLTRRSVCNPRIVTFFKALRSDPLPEIENLKIGVAGFCWGGQHAIILAHDTPSSRVHRPGTESGQVQKLVDCAHTAHPSFLKVPDDIEAVSSTVPLSIAIGNKDMVLKLPLVVEVKEILEKKKAGDNEVVVYEGGKHGFAVRGDPSDPKQVEIGENARKQALSWFERWLT